MTFSEELTKLRTEFDTRPPVWVETVQDADLGVEGYVVVWNTKISEGGPLNNCGKGGTRIKPDLTLDEIKMLARSMALKMSAAGLPLGGSKSGLKADPKADGFERKYRRFVSLCKPFLHENGGVFGGFGFDIGADPVHAIWACDELNSTRCFTGKPLEMGGTDYDREGIAGLGVAIAAKTLLEEHGETAKSTTYAVQGLGAMGAAVVRYFDEYGGALRAISDPLYGGTWAFESDPPTELIEAIIQRDTEEVNTLFPTCARKVSEDTQDVLYQEVDVLFPCAVQYVLTEENVSKLKSRFILEGANNATTDGAYRALYDMGIIDIPGIIANPGGVIAAFVELTSNSENKVQEAKDMTIQKIAENVRLLMALVRQHKVSPADVAEYMALSNIIHGLKR